MPPEMVRMPPAMLALVPIVLLTRHLKRQKVFYPTIRFLAPVFFYKMHVFTPELGIRDICVKIASIISVRSTPV